MNTKVTITNGEDFEVEGITFRFYDFKLWIDGGKNDDVYLRDIDTDEDEVEIEITDQDIEEAEDYINQIRNDNEGVLLEVMTAGEVCKTYNLTEGAVRKAIRQTQIPARKSAGTWLLRRADVEARWGNRAKSAATMLLVAFWLTAMLIPMW